MALSELDMMNLWAKQLTGYKSQWERLFGVGYAIEAEVRKQDEALIRQLVESMCWAARVMTISEDEAPGYFAVISTARARLEEKPCA